MTRWPYLVIGTILGTLWVVQRNTPVWEHLIRTGAALMIIPPIAHLVRDRVLRAKGITAHAYLSLPRLVAAKLALIGTAFTLDWLIGMWTGHAALAVDIALGAAITLTIGLGGPVLHPRFVISRPENRPLVDRPASARSADGDLVDGRGVEVGKDLSTPVHLCVPLGLLAAGPGDLRRTGTRPFRSPAIRTPTILEVTCDDVGDAEL